MAKKQPGLDLVIARKALAELLQRVAPAAEKAKTLPILQTVRLDAHAPGRLAATATDLDVELTGRAEATVRAEGAVCVDAAHLSALVAALPAEASVEMTREGETLRLRSGRTSARFALSPVEDFPAHKAAETTHHFAIAAETLADGLGRGGFAQAADETRYYLNGVFLHATADGEALRFISTDGARLSRVAVEAPEGAEGMPGVIVPTRAVQLLRKLAKAGGEALVDVGPTRLRVAFGDGALALSTKLIDGTFPDYERVIPEASRLARVGVSRAALAAALKRAVTVAEDKSRAVRFLVDGRTMTLSSAATHGDEVEETLDVEHEGPTREIGFNGKFVLDALEHVAEDAVELLLGDAAGPAILRAAGAETDLAVLMPMRV